MLGKVMKYDIKKMTKILIIMYAISLILAGITRLINIGKEIQAIFIIGQVFAGLTYSAIGNILVNTFVHILKVFITKFYKDESYLTHTLPVKKGTLLMSMFLSSLIVVIASVLVCFLSLFIIFYSPSFMQTINMIISATIVGFNMPSWLFISLIVFIIFAQICAMLAMAFTAIIKANTYNYKRILKGLLWFALYYIVSMVAVVLVSVIVLAIQRNVSQLMASQMNSVSFTTILVIGFVVYALCAIIFYFFSKMLFNKGVNVD